MEHHLHSTTDTSAKLQSSIPGAGRTVGEIAKETVLISHSITTMRCDLTHTTHSNIPSSSKVSKFFVTLYLMLPIQKRIFYSFQT